MIVHILLWFSWEPTTDSGVVAVFNDEEDAKRLKVDLETHATNKQFRIHTAEVR